MPSDLLLRPGTPEDADAVATLYLGAREASYPAIPRTIHPPDDVRRWLRSRLEAGGDVEVWLAERDDVLLGMLLLEGAWLHSLYVAPGRTGQGIGTTLLELAKSRRPDGLGLWVFETNVAAQRFYRRHGFGVVRRTDGTGPDGNEEHEPDLEMAWPDPSSLEGMRRRIDVLDDQLAELLDERAQLTARVQRLKEVPGQAGRDAAREAQIAARMAERAPRLGADRLARIMHTVITESLDAAAAEGTAADPPDPADTPGGHP